MNLIQRQSIFWILILLLALVACDTGSEATATPVADTTGATADDDDEETAEETEELTEADEPAVDEAGEEPSAVPTDTPQPEPTATATPEPAAVETIATFAEAPCEFVEPAGYESSCGYLTVPEDRSQPDGNNVRLHVAIFASVSDDPAPDPLIYFEGGPGGEPLETLIYTFEDYFAPFLADREVIIFDQRGTGFSQPSLACPEIIAVTLEYLDDKLSDEEEAEIYINAMSACHDRLVEDGINTAAYNSRENAADVNDLRLALGYDEWNLYGISYGTKLAMTVMRDYPTGIRSVILDSAYPLPSSLVTDVPKNIDRAFNTFFAGCAADPDCAAAYPDLESTFFDTVAALDESSPVIEVTDFFTAERYDGLITGDVLVATLFQSLYSAELIPLLPKLITDTTAGDYQLLGLLVSNNISNQQFISHGMNASVQCHEEVIFSTLEEARAALSDFPQLADFFGDPSIDFQICDLWGAGTANAVENEAVNSDIPTLVLAGEYDPITPPAFGQLAADTLSNSYYFLFPGLGHGVSVSGDCPQGMTLEFITDPTTTPDSSCIATLTGPDFETPVAAGDEVAVELVPFTSDQGFSVIEGMIPAGWEEQFAGTFIRGNNAIDQTSLVIQAVPGVSPEMFADMLASQLGLEENLAELGTYEDAVGRTWSLNSGSIQGLPVDIGLAEEGEYTFLVILISNPEEQEMLLETVFLPVLDTIMVIEE